MHLCARTEGEVQELWPDFTRISHGARRAGRGMALRALSHWRRSHQYHAYLSVTMQWTIFKSFTLNTGERHSGSTEGRPRSASLVRDDFPFSRLLLGSEFLRSLDVPTATTPVIPACSAALKGKIANRSVSWDSNVSTPCKDVRSGRQQRLRRHHLHASSIAASSPTGFGFSVQGHSSRSPLAQPRARRCLHR